MSVLRVPRVIVKGGALWNPNTTNNNDQFPTYDFVNADLNWSYLAQQTPPITPENYRTLFPTWILTPKLYTPQHGPAYYQPPSEWNFYGGNDWSLRPPGNPTAVSGGQLAYGGPLVTTDPLVGALADLVGDPFPGSTTPSAGRLVDINPDAFWSSTFRVRTFRLGDAANPARYLSGDLPADSVPSTRWINVARNLGDDVEIAGSGGIALQLCLPNRTLRIDAGASPLLAALDEARRAPGVAGLMMRLQIYLTQYFTGPEFADCQGLNAQYARLLEIWDQQLASRQPPLQNPAVSRVVGTIGLWVDGELQTAPGGRFLAPVAPAPGKVPLGLALAELHADAAVLSLDLGGTVPEVDASATKADVGPLGIALQLPNGQRRSLGVLQPVDYARGRYEASSGIVDLALPAGVSPADVAAGTLVVQAADGTILLSETGLFPSALRVETDDRALYVDEGDSGSMTIRVFVKGDPPAQPINVLIRQYLPVPPPPQANTSAWSLADPTKGEEILRFAGVTGEALVIEPSTGGAATLTFEGLRPGFPIVVFFPFVDGDPVPTPPDGIGPVGPPSGPPLNIASAFYTTVRVMPFDNALPAQLIDLWNSTHDRQAVWDFVYGKVLFLYDMIFPVMRHYAHIDLSDRHVVEQSIGWIVRMSSDEMHRSTAYMPVTRDLSAGKQAVLQIYARLVAGDWAIGRIGPPEPRQSSP